MDTPVYQLYTMGHHGHEVFCGTFSSLECALKRVDQMMIHLRNTWVELDYIDLPTEDPNIVWKTNVSVN